MMMTMMMVMTMMTMMRMMTMRTMMMMMMIDHIYIRYIYILKVHRHGISKIRNLSVILARSNVRVAPYMFYDMTLLMIIEGSLEVKLPTIWTVEKQR